VNIKRIDSPPNEWESPTNAFKAAYEHEVEIVGMIDGLVALAREENENATENMVQWLVAEQVEEEATIQDILDKLRHVGDDGTGLLMVDHELAQRGGNNDGTQDTEGAAPE
jgi:ferritin